MSNAREGFYSEGRVPPLAPKVHLKFRKTTKRQNIVLLPTMTETKTGGFDWFHKFVPGIHEAMSSLSVTRSVSQMESVSPSVSQMVPISESHRSVSQ